MRLESWYVERVPIPGRYPEELELRGSSPLVLRNMLFDLKHQVEAAIERVEKDARG